MRLVSVIVLALLALPAYSLVAGPERPGAELEPGAVLAGNRAGSGEQSIRVAAKAKKDVKINAKQAADAVKKRYDGRILKVKLIQSKGPPVYRVRTLSAAGVVKVVFVDGTTGDVFE